MEYMPRDIVEKLKRDLNYIANSAVKNSCPKEISYVMGVINNFDFKDPYIGRKLKQTLGYAIEASGRSRDKEHWKSQCQNCWYVFERSITSDS